MAEADKVVLMMSKCQLFFLICLGFVNVGYAGSQLNEGDCVSLYTPSGTFWDYTSGSDPSSALGAQCTLLYTWGDQGCPAGKHYRCCLTIAGANKTSDTDYLGGVNTYKAGWLVYKQYSTKAELFHDVNSGELKRVYQKCLTE
ncbi:hypothetical protein [Endozoicomonas sp. ALD040]|uniref:hypothetical protein n=1 Tax=Endozoicomonas sp. ALD040 TaxID=3403079 RepID=UPI003BAE9209